MTEDEWLRSQDPDPLWRYLEVPDPSPHMLRKSRLLACALARLAWPVYSDQEKEVIESLEQYADGNAQLEDFSALVANLFVRAESEMDSEVDSWRKEARGCVLALSSARHPNYPLRFAVIGGKLALTAYHRSDEICKSNQIPEICDALRDIFGNPFRPVAVAPGWLTTGAVTLARKIYDDRTFDQMPQLADVLENAGCDHSAILDHCRQTTDHVRGCWVVDLILDKMTMRC